MVTDMTIANVVLPNMMGALGKPRIKLQRVLTSYSMAEAVFIPLAGFFTLRFGERTVILTHIGFVVMSCLCGQSDSC